MENGERIDEDNEALDAARASFKKAQSKWISTTPGSLADAYRKYKREGPLWELPISKASALRAVVNGFERALEQCPNIPELSEAIERNRKDYRKEIDELKKRFSENTLKLLEKDYPRERVDDICEAILDFENLLLEAERARKLMDGLSFNLGEIKDTKRIIDLLLKKNNIRRELITELKKERARLAALEELPAIEIDSAKSLLLSREGVKRSALLSSFPHDQVRYNFYYLSLIAMPDQKKKSNWAEKMFYEALQVILFKLLTKPDIPAKEARRRTADLINDTFKESNLGLKKLASNDIDKALNATGWSPE